MDHQPYKNWLLDDERLSAEQERDLRSHLRNCPECAALDRSNMVLRAAPMSVPAPDFTARFQVRLAAERRAQRVSGILSIGLVLVVGTGALLFLLPSYLAYLSLSPTQFAVTLISPLVNLAVTLYTTSLSGSPLVDVVISFVPPYMWALSLALFGVGCLWVLSLRKFTRLPRVSARADSILPGDNA
jgi:hypothetical protein